jgi:hypothetical protein
MDAARAARSWPPLLLLLVIDCGARSGDVKPAAMASGAMAVDGLGDGALILGA